jgi:hypothetical protein
MRELIKYFLATCVGIAGCGDCISLGYTSATVTAADANSRTPLPLAGGTFVVTSNGRPPVSTTLPSTWPNGQAFDVCCATGALRVQLTLQGYAPLDTMIEIGSKGSCHVPELSNVVLLLRRTSVAVTAPAA